MNILQMFATGLCGVLTWLCIMPSCHIPNKRYLRLFWFFFIIFFLSASVITAISGIHDKWYMPGVAIIICALAAGFISIHIAPNKQQ